LLRRLSWKKFLSWKAFDEIEPIGGKRLDYLVASIVSTLVNLRRNVEKYPSPFPLGDFLLNWGVKSGGSVKPPPKPQKTWQQLKLMGQILAGMYNAAEDEHQRKLKRQKKR
jgi:hypothetical protein